MESFGGSFFNMQGFFSVKRLRKIYILIKYAGYFITLCNIFNLNKDLNKKHNYRKLGFAIILKYLILF